MPDPTLPVDGPPTGKAIALIAIVALFAYFNSLHGAYVLDDGLIFNNPNVTRPFHGGLKTRPVIAVSVTLNYWLDKTNPRGYHLFNLVIHVLAAICLWDLVRRVLRLPPFQDRFRETAGWVGLIVALVWMVHPLTTQAVTYVIQRCESLMSLFFLGSLWCFFRGATAERRARWWYSAATISAALGAGCKEIMIALPPVLVLFDRAFLAGSWRGVLRRWKVHALIAIPPVVGIVAFVAAGYVTGKESSIGVSMSLFTPFTYALTQTEVILHYLRLTFWPTGQCLDYLDWPIPTFPAVWRSLIPIAAMLLVTLYGVLWRRTWGFPAAAFFLILAPTSSVMPIQDAAFEHRMYLPLTAIVVLVVVGVARVVGWCRAKWPASEQVTVRVAGGFAVGVVFLLAMVTVVRNEVYASALTMYADNAAKRPDNARVRATYAGMLFKMGETADAERELRAALKAPRQLPGNLAALVAILFETGRTDEALKVCKTALASTPNDAGLNRQYGLLLLITDRPTEAVAIYQAVVATDSPDPGDRLRLGMALIESGQQAAGRDVLRDLARENPDALRTAADAARMIAVDPAAPDHRIRLVVLSARAVCDSSDSPTPENLDTLAIALARAGRFSEAATVAGRAAAAAEGAGWDAYRVALLRKRESLFRDEKPFLPSSFDPSPAREVRP